MNCVRRVRLLLVLAIASATTPTLVFADSLHVGSKQFTESVILGEMLAQLGRADGFAVEHRRQLGGSRIVWQALLNGQIDAYVDYTGTLRQELLAGESVGPGLEGLRATLAAQGLGLSRPLGFNNTYALGLRPETAAELGLRTISDLRTRPELSFGFSNEFLARGDGWPGLRDRYGLPQRNVAGLEHDLAYRGLAAGGIDVIDLYSTDAEIAYYGLQVLEDDRGYFPRYEAVIVYRLDLRQRAPDFLRALRQLEGTLDEATMARLNARVKLEGEREAEVAASFLRETLSLEIVVPGASRGRAFLRHTRDHLVLVGTSLALAIVVAIPLGIAAARHARLGQAVLAATGVLQTVPSLALLVFMIPLLGIGAGPAIAALFVYSLLPIVRNTHAGLTHLSPLLRDSAAALGLTAAARLRHIELPLAAPAILAGIKTSAVINIGTATLGALIGAGGYGQPILTGIRLDDTSLILQGAVPAAALALLVQGAFELIERRLVSPGLR